MSVHTHLSHDSTAPGLHDLANRWNTPRRNEPSTVTKVLIVGDDPLLLSSRRDVLEQTGYRVITCTSRESEQMLSGFVFDIVLICRSVAQEDAGALAQRAHATSPRQRVVLLRPADPDEMRFFDTVIDSILGPEHLLRRLAQINQTRSLTDSMS